VPTVDLEDRRPRFTVVEADALDKTTTLQVRDAIFEAKDLAMNTRTHEIVVVQGVSDSAISCRRGVGSSATPMAKGDELLRLGSIDDG
jgi:hypothetical protein